MRGILIGAALCLALIAQPCFAQQTPAPQNGDAQSTTPPSADIDPARLAAARRVVADNGTRATEQTLIAQLMPSLCQTIGHAQGLNDQQIATVTGVVMDEMSSSVDDLVEITVRVYASHFTAAQLSAMVEFYESPAGRAYIAEMPGLLHDSMTVSRQWAQTTLAPRVTARIEAIAHQQQQQHP